MAETNEYIEGLKEMRSWYLEQRRKKVSTALELRKANGDGGMWAIEVSQANNAIEALDKAIEHEKKLANPPKAGVL